MDLNYVEERFGSWMVQYGYTNYITEDELNKNCKGYKNKKLVVNEDEYSTLVIFYSPFIKEDTMDIISNFLKSGGNVVWSSVYPLDSERESKLIESWMDIFGIKSMEILTDMLPDYIYPVIPLDDVMVVANLGDEVVGTYKEYPDGGTAVYLGFRPRDDQSGSTGEDVDTLFRILQRIGAYREGSFEVLSRETNSKFLINRFKNGAVSITNHIRNFYEDWDGKYFRDEEEDEKALEGRILPEKNIILKNYTINGKEITYHGEGILTVNISEDGKLNGFSGENTNEIIIDRTKYKFSDKKGNISWCRISDEHLEEDINIAYAIYFDQTGKLRIPIEIDNPEKHEAAVCKSNLFDSKKFVSYICQPGNVAFDITESEKDKWILLFKRK